MNQDDDQPVTNSTGQGQGSGTAMYDGSGNDPEADNEVSMSSNPSPTRNINIVGNDNYLNEDGNANAPIFDTDTIEVLVPNRWSDATENVEHMPEHPVNMNVRPNNDSLVNFLMYDPLRNRVTSALHFNPRRPTNETPHDEAMSINQVDGDPQARNAMPVVHETQEPSARYVPTPSSRIRAIRSAIGSSQFGERHLPVVIDVRSFADAMDAEREALFQHYGRLPDPSHFQRPEPASHASLMVTDLAGNYEPIIIESDDSNSSTIPDVAVASGSGEQGDEGDIDEQEELDQPPTKLAKIESPCDGFDMDDSDGQTCSICLDSWTVSGEHRLSALKCGHLFGLACIERWLKQMTKTNRCCPTCKTRACTKDIRHIYAKRLAVVDNTEVENLRTEIETTKTEKHRVEMELQKAVLSQQLFFNKITKLEREIIQLKQACIDPVPVVKNWNLVVRANLELVAQANASCRILAYNSRNKELYASQMSTNTLFPGYGMRKISCFDWKLGKLMNLHPKLIRDAAYSDENDMLLTVSLDKTVKLVRGSNEEVLSTVTTDVALWSCCWDESNTNRFYVGGVGGIVLEYDIRQPRACIKRIPPTVDASPVASLAYVPNGVLACHLNSFHGHLKNGSEYESKQLPIDGSLLCVRRNPVTEDILVSCRPSGNYIRNRHLVCKIDLQNDFDFLIKKTFEASTTQTLMARSAIYSIGDEEYVAAHSESHKSMYIWSLSSKKGAYSLDTSDNVVDILPIVKDNGDMSHIVSLTQTKTRIYEAVGVL